MRERERSKGEGGRKEEREAGREGGRERKRESKCGNTFK